MRPFTNADLPGLLGEQRPPCVSIYLPTQRGYPDNRQGPLHYRNLLERVEESLRRKYPGAQVRALLDRFHGLETDQVFWTHRLDGLAVLGSPEVFHAFDLHRPVPERAIVADSFHVKPLLRMVQSADRFHVLCLQREEVRLYEGNRDGLDRIEPPGVPLTVTAALGDAVVVQRKEQTKGGKSPGEPRPAPRGPNVPPGHAATRDDAKLESERFFRAVDRAVWERVSRPSDLPLVVAALPEHQAIFRAVSHNPRLLEAGIERGPASLADGQLRAEAWKCVEPIYLARLGRFVEDFRTAQSRGMGSDDLDAVARAAHGGRVGILLVEADRVIPGRLDPETGEARRAEGGESHADDLLDDLAEKVIRTKGSVVIVPEQRMPTATGLAAIYRF